MTNASHVKGWRCQRHGTQVDLRAARRIRLTVGILLIFLLLIPGGCVMPGEPVFPTLKTDGHSVPGQTASTDETSTTGISSGEPVTLTVAVPFGNDAADLLRLLFLARTSGQLPGEDGQLIGQHVQADDLAPFDGSLQIAIQTVSATAGATAGQILLWQAAAQMPDVLYVRSAAQSPGLDQLLDLQEWVFDDALLSAGHIYAEALNSMRTDQILYGIPYLASTPMVFFNQKLLEQFHTENPDLNQTWEDWQNLLARLQSAVSLDGQGATPANLALYAEFPQQRDDHLRQSVFLLENPVDFLPFLPASLAMTSGWAMWQGPRFTFADSSFKISADWLRRQVQMGYSPWHLSFEDRITALKVNSARTDNRVIFWVGDSTDLSTWHQQTALPVGECFMPAGARDIRSNLADSASGAVHALLDQRLPVEIRSLVVSKTTREPALAAAFAVFLALDVDSLLLQSRFQLYEGLFPLVQEQAVWEAMVARQPFGYILLTIKDRMPYAYCSGRQMIASWDATMNQVFQQLGARYLSMTDTSGLTPLLEDISKAVPRILAEE